MIRISQSVERMSETFGRLLRVIRGRRTRKSKLSRLIGMRVSRYCLLTKFLMRIYDNERSVEDYPLPCGHSIYREVEVLNIQNISPIAIVRIFLVIFLRFFTKNQSDFNWIYFSKFYLVLGSDIFGKNQIYAMAIIIL